MKIESKEDWLNLVIEYDACGTDALKNLDITDKQKESVICAHRDFRYAEDKYGDAMSDDYCEEAKDAAYGYMTEFNEVA